MKQFLTRTAGALSRVGAEFALHVAANYPSASRIQDNARLDLASGPWLDHVTAATETRPARQAGLRGDVIDVDLTSDQRQLAVLTRLHHGDPPAALLYLINTSTAAADVGGVLPDPLDVTKLIPDRLGLCARFVPVPSSGAAPALRLRSHRHEYEYVYVSGFLFMTRRSFTRTTGAFTVTCTST